MNQGENILTLVRGTQRLNAEIASLLKTFEKLAGDRDYRNEKGGPVTNGCSLSVDSPEYWAPPFMFRVLQNKKNKDDILALNVVLDSPEDPDQVNEPLLLLVRFQYRKDEAKAHVGEWGPWDLWFSRPKKELNRVYTRKDLKLDSAEFQEDSEWDDKSFNAMQEVTFLAVPLAAMTDSKTLEREVIKRVL